VTDGAIPTTRLSAPARPRAFPVARALLAAARPRQWVKNVLLLAAPAAAGVIGEPRAAERLGVAVLAFCAASAGGYLINDVHDVDEDRAHPRKRLRPVASGVLPPVVAVAVAAGMLVAAGGLGALLGWRFLAVLTAYVALTLSYSFVLREIAIIDLAAVAGCHVLRAAAGGVAVGVPLSRWFLIVACFGSLFVVAGKRLGDLVEFAGEPGAGRSTLEEYSVGFLHHVLTISSAVAITAYCLWAFEGRHSEWPAAASVVPLALFFLRYALLLDQGRGGAPEELIVGDRALGAIALLWVALFAGAVHL